ADAAVAAATNTHLIDTPSLAIGTWLLAFSAEVVNGGATAGDCGMTLAIGSAAGTFAGPVSADGELPAISGGAVSLATTCLVTITTAGQVSLYIYSAVACTVKRIATSGINGLVTGIVAVQIA
ncbi:MAG TPA: hypothetical protein VMU66_05625, partial [Gaiellales bacterium]|nr:hypothetical protein [Gaiellales bacterium]